MSLLMDALKKAEEAKRNAAGNSDAAPDESFSLSLEPLPLGESNTLQPPLPVENPIAQAELPAINPDVFEAKEQEIQRATYVPPAPRTPSTDIRATFAEEHIPEARAKPLTSTSPLNTPQSRIEPATLTAKRPTESATPAQRESVQNLFASKHPPATKKSFAIITGGATVLAVIGIAGYFWWQLQPRNGLSAPPANIAAVRPPPPPPPQITQNAPAPSPVVAVAQPEPATETVRHPIALENKEAAPSRREKASLLGQRESTESAIPSSNTPIRFSSNKPRINPLVSQAYDALQSGNLSIAQQAYERVLNAEPKNSDALYGLAAIALQKNQPEVAEDYYLRALEADPRDPVAQSGLIGLRGQAAGNNAESRLKNLIAEQPGVGSLYFALGNVYARQDRWRDAQQAYFQAFRSESDNADIAFNLAVSLDQIHQAKAAAQYYAEAIRLAAIRPFGFDKNLAKARLRELQP